MDFGSRNEDPCEKRVCVGADEIFKKGKKLIKERQDAQTPSTSQTSDVKDTTNRECPLDKDELGHHSWNLLHTMSVYYPDKPSDEEKKNATTFINTFAKMYPCDVCAKDLQKDLIDIPPQVGSRDEFAAWMCLLHNRVNDKIGKSIFDCSKVMERWKDGWKDGSCQ